MVKSNQYISPEDQLLYALENLLKVTKRKLIITVPYEQQAEVAYGHEQVFSHEKLEQLGMWCVEQMGGKGSVVCEDVMGGSIDCGARKQLMSIPLILS